MKTFVVGDIHGALKALTQCLVRSNFNSNTDTLIVLGDVCDGFPEVKECVELLLNLKNMVYVLGNHDAWFDDYIRTGIAQPIWTSQGGNATLHSYCYGIPDEHAKLFRTAQAKYIDYDRNQLHVHGGFSLGMKFENNSSEIFMWDRTLYQSAKRVSSFKTHKYGTWDDIFIGHTCTGTKEPFHGCNVWNLDQGAGWNGWLTIMDVDTKEYWQSDNVLDLYPDYNGRFKMVLNENKCWQL